MLKLVAKLAGHGLQFSGYSGRDILAGYGFPTTLRHLAGLERNPL